MVERNAWKAFMADVLNFFAGKDNNVVQNFKICFPNGEEEKFIKELNVAKDLLNKDVEFFSASDPAVDSNEEIRITYPGYMAIAYYRVAHFLRNMGYKIESRIITELAHSRTGIDIHPGAQIGVPFFIDHGTGIVIGETAVIGERVKLYQGVTLGALSLSKGAALKGIKRHPTIGNDVTIYSGASILGDIKIGNDVIIGSNTFITDNIPDHTKVSIGKPILVMKQK